MAAAAGFSVKAELEVAVGFAPALPNKPLDGAAVPVFPNKPVLAGLAGGTPAGVVDGIENRGLAGVAVAAVLAVAGVGAWEPEAGVLAPNSEEGLAVPNRFPAVGAGVGVVCALAVLPALFPNKPPLVDGVVDALLPNRPPVDGAVLVVALPNKPPEVVDAPVAAPPKRPPVAGVVEDPPPNRPPPEVVGVAEAEGMAFPEKSPPVAGFCAAVLPWPPNKPPGGLVAGVVDFPKEKPGVPEAAGAVPNRPPAAGAVLVVLLGAAPEVLGVPKLKAMAIGVVYLVLV